MAALMVDIGKLWRVLTFDYHYIQKRLKSDLTTQTRTTRPTPSIQPPKVTRLVYTAFAVPIPSIQIDRLPDRGDGDVQVVAINLYSLDDWSKATFFVMLGGPNLGGF